MSTSIYNIANILKAKKEMCRDRFASILPFPMRPPKNKK